MAVAEEPPFPPMAPADVEEIDEAQQERQVSLKQASVEAQEDGNLALALEKMTEAICIGAATAMMYSRRAQLLAQLGRWGAVINDCKAALKINPDSAKAFKMRARAYAKRQQWEKAHADFAQGLKLDFDEDTAEASKEAAAKVKEMQAAAVAERLRQEKVYIPTKMPEPSRLAATDRKAEATKRKAETPEMAEKRRRAEDERRRWEAERPKRLREQEEAKRVEEERRAVEEEERRQKEAEEEAERKRAAALQAEIDELEREAAQAEMEDPGVGARASRFISDVCGHRAEAPALKYQGFYEGWQSLKRDRKYDNKTFYDKIAAMAVNNNHGVKPLKDKEGNVILYYTVHENGTGNANPIASTQCDCHYQGVTIDGNIFDSSFERGSPTSFAPEQVIKGWTAAMLQMVEGDMWEMYIPSEHAYGSKGSGAKIPADATLVFVMRMVRIKGFSQEVVQGTRSQLPTATFFTNMGKFKAEIYLDRVPKTASNFIDLCRSGFYNGIHFHRVIPGFMGQFGCPHAKDPFSRDAGLGGPPDGEYRNLKTGAVEKRFNGGNIEDENISRDTNAPGTLSMANCGAPNTGGSQMFFNVADNRNLDWFSPGESRHPVFGKIVEGYDVVLAITRVNTREDTPCKPIKMKWIQIDGAPEPA